MFGVWNGEGFEENKAISQWGKLIFTYPCEDHGKMMQVFQGGGEEGEEEVVES